MFLVCLHVLLRTGRYRFDLKPIVSCFSLVGVDYQLMQTSWYLGFYIPTNFLGFIGLFINLIVLIPMICEEERRRFPAVLATYMIILGVFQSLSLVFPIFYTIFRPLGGWEELTCHNSYTQAHIIHGDFWCTFQGSIYIIYIYLEFLFEITCFDLYLSGIVVYYIAMCGNFWLVAFAFNLLLTVLRVNWALRNPWLLHLSYHIFVWGLGWVFTVVAIAAQRIGYCYINRENFGFSLKSLHLCVA